MAEKYQSVRAAYGVSFKVGRAEALDGPDSSLGGMLAWYSLIHIPQNRSGLRL